MLTYPNIDPVAVSIGPLEVHWYGLMYLAGFAAGWALGRWRTRQAWRGLRPVDMDDVLFYVVLGIVWALPFEFIFKGVGQPDSNEPDA